MCTASKTFHQILATGLFASCLLALSVNNTTQAASTIVDANGFESYNPMNLDGQSDWVRAGTGGGTAVVQNSVVNSGSQAVRIDRAPESSDRWAVPVGMDGHPTNRYILIDWDMNVTATNATAGIFGPFFGVDSYDDTISPKVLGSLGVDATTGDVLYQAAGTGVLTETSTNIAFGVWNHFQIQLDFLEDKYSVLLNNTVLATTGFVDGPTDTFTDADLAAFAASFDTNSKAQAGTAYFDNFLVRNVDSADFNIDGNVDGTDLSAWASAYGSSAGGDSDGDGDTDGNDFLNWQRDFNGSAAPLTTSLTSIPEPSTLTLLMLSLLAGTRIRRR